MNLFCEYLSYISGPLCYPCFKEALGMSQTAMTPSPLLGIVEGLVSTSNKDAIPLGSII